MNPKGNIVRTDITSVEASSTFPDRLYVFTISSKSSEKWHVSANDEVIHTSVSAHRLHMYVGMHSHVRRHADVHVMHV